jgi:glutathione S-transferase
VIRVHRIPFSTNVERVALAAGIKGVEVEWVDHANEDRSGVLALSGQELVPVAEFGADVVAHAVRIIERFEAENPEPPLYPLDPAERARTDTFIEWFNRVWKGPPNAIDDERAKPAPDERRIAACVAEACGWTPRFEAMLTAGPYLMGSSVTAADVIAFPFLKYALVATEPGDAEPFHPILEECLKPADDFPRLVEWVRRVDALPRA